MEEERKSNEPFIDYFGNDAHQDGALAFYKLLALLDYYATNDGKCEIVNDTSVPYEIRYKIGNPGYHESYEYLVEVSNAINPFYVYVRDTLEQLGPTADTSHFERLDAEFTELLDGLPDKTLYAFEDVCAEMDLCRFWG